MRDLSGTGQYLTLSSGLGILANDPIWAFIWVEFDVTTTTQVLLSIGQSGAGSERRYVLVGSNTVQAISQPAAGAVVASTAWSTTGVKVGVLAEWPSASLRAITVNNGTRVTETTSRALSGDANQVRVGATHTASAPFNGRIGPFGIYRGTVTADDARALWAGIDPGLIRPADQLDVLELTGRHSPEVSLKGNAYTITGSPGYADAPRLFRRARRSMIFVPSTASGQNTDSTPAIATWTAPAATAAPGTVTATSTPATAAWAAPAATAAPGTATATASPAVASWIAPAATATAGAVTVTAAPAVSSWVAPAATATPGAITATASPATAAWSVPAATASPGTATATATAASAVWVAPAADATTSGQVLSTPAVTTWIAPAATAQPGAVTVDAQPAVATWSAPAATATGGNTVTATSSSLSWVAPAAAATSTVTVAALAPAVASWVAPAASATPGAMTAVSVAAVAIWVAPAAAAYDGSIPTYTVLRIAAARAGRNGITARTGRLGFGARTHLSE